MEDPNKALKKFLEEVAANTEKADIPFKPKTKPAAKKKKAPAKKKTAKKAK
jgi:hypothetical protein